MAVSLPRSSGRSAKERNKIKRRRGEREHKGKDLFPPLFHFSGSTTKFNSPAFVSLPASVWLKISFFFNFECFHYFLAPLPLPAFSSPKHHIGLTTLLEIESCVSHSLCHLPFLSFQTGYSGNSSWGKNWITANSYQVLAYQCSTTAEHLPTGISLTLLTESSFHLCSKFTPIQNPLTGCFHHTLSPVELCGFHFSSSSSGSKLCFCSYQNNEYFSSKFPFFFLNYS